MVGEAAPEVEPTDRMAKPGRPSGGDDGFSKPAPVAEEINLDWVLINELGQFGRFQLTNLLLVSIPIIMSAFMSEYIFSAAAVPHRYYLSLSILNSFRNRADLFSSNKFSVISLKKIEHKFCAHASLF